MSFINPSDMVEEDAADLQFPKDAFGPNENIITITPTSETKYTTKYYNSIPTSALASNSRDSHFYNSPEFCIVCQEQLQVPYIKCAECVSTFVCVQCFSIGKETNKHLNTHSYAIVHENIHIFSNSEWTISDERKLLEFIEIWGYGNWEDISKAFCNKFSSKECSKHYHKYYFDGIFKEKLGLTNEYYFPQRVPYCYKMNSVDPPRCNNNDIFNNQNMAGYRCARSDFDIPYDKSAEHLINLIDMNDGYSSVDDISFESNDYTEIESDLKLAIIQSYNNRLRERHRRYKIMRKHGLLVPNKTQSWLSKYMEAIKLHLNPTGIRFETGARRIASFMQICDPVAFDMLIESFQYYAELKKYVFNLYDFRSNGIKTLSGAKVYNRLKIRRHREYRDKKIYEKLYDWRNIATNEHGGDGSTLGEITGFIGQPRRKARPINIIGFPGYDKLTDDERNLCSNVRVLPASYLQFKNVLQTECAKLGFLRLADARRLIKIDVNKTRQLYDFLITNGYVYKPPN